MTINLRLPAALIAAGLSFNAWAEADSRIENLVTTAHRTPLPPAQLGSAVSVVSRE